MSKVLEELREIVAEKGPEYRVARCLYFDVVERVRYPVCIVGHWLDRRGLLGAVRGMQNAMAFHFVADNDAIGSKLTASDVAVLCAAQRVQDEGGTWGDALAAAEYRA